MSAIRSFLVSLGLYQTRPCARTLQEPAPADKPIGAEGESVEEVRLQWRDAIHKNRNLQQTAVQIARRSTCEWNNAESMAAKAIAEIQRRRGDEDR